MNEPWLPPKAAALFYIHFSGDHKAVARPVPIPNTAVKHSLADGSGPIGSARVGCRQIFFLCPSLFPLSCFKILSYQLNPIIQFALAAGLSPTVSSSLGLTRFRPAFGLRCGHVHYWDRDGCARAEIPTEGLLGVC